mgnify:CR=1 FL=1
MVAAQEQVDESKDEGPNLPQLSVHINYHSTPVGLRVSGIFEMGGIDLTGKFYKVHFRNILQS